MSEFLISNIEGVTILELTLSNGTIIHFNDPFVYKETWLNFPETDIVIGNFIKDNMSWSISREDNYIMFYLSVEMKTSNFTDISFIYNDIENFETLVSNIIEHVNDNNLWNN